MKFPTLTELNASREMIDVFGGYNHNLRIGSGEFYDMKNLTSTHYPVLSPRPKRGVYNLPTLTANPTALISKDNLCYVDGSDFYINKHKVEGLTLDKDALPKSLVSMGAYVIILPDKVWVNTQPKAGEKAYGNIDAELTYNEGVITFDLYNMSRGENYDLSKIKFSSEAPADPEDGQLWYDTSGDTQTIRQYSSTQKQWVAIPTTYVKITFPSNYDLREYFEVGDAVTIAGLTYALNVDGDALWEDKVKIKEFDNTMTIYGVGVNYVIVKGIVERHGLVRLVLYEPDTDIVWARSEVSIKRQMPIMDYVVESGNRLWGCHYGVALNGEVVNEIYASKLGDFKNWNTFDSISTDSYVASVGTDGAFTGAITHLGYPIFFKENCFHKVYGSYPSNYQIQTTTCRGVQKGCNKSLAIVNEVLYYKSQSAICAFDGSLPVEISSALGDVAYSNAVAGSLGNKYYISMQDAKGEDHLFVYDTVKGMWHREDDTRAEAFCNNNGNLYYIEGDKIKAVNVLSDPEGYTDQEPINWKAESGIIGTDSPDKKYISRLVVRLSLEVGTKVFFYIEYDSSGSWEHMFSISGTSLRTFSIPIRPKRCDHLRLKIEGEGDAKIFSICKTIEQGSDV